MKSDSGLGQSLKASWVKTMFSPRNNEKYLADDRQSETTLIERYVILTTQGLH